MELWRRTFPLPTVLHVDHPLADGARRLNLPMGLCQIRHVPAMANHRRNVVLHRNAHQPGQGAALCSRIGALEGGSAHHVVDQRGGLGT